MELSEIIRQLEEAGWRPPELPGGQRSDQPIQFIRKPKIRDYDGLSDTQRWRLEGEGKYPKRIKIGHRSVAWNLAEVQAWVHAKIKAAGRVPSPPLPKSRRAAGDAA